MQSARIPSHRPLWLPTQDLLQHQSSVASPDLELEKEAAAGHSDPTEEKEDDLDRLFQQYAAEAAADRQAVERDAKKEKPLAQKSMAELRSEGLASALSSDNKGYQLLAKMGYREGQGIGRAGRGMAAPLDLNLKSGRRGLGVDEDKKRKREVVRWQYQEEKKKREVRVETAGRDFKLQTATGFALRKAEAHLIEARKVCETLDRRVGIEHSAMWPQEPPPEEELEAVAGNAAALERAAAASEPAAAACKLDAAAALPADTWEDLPVLSKLAEVLAHLRERHAYCLFCGCQYADGPDLDANCPGLTEDDH